MKKQLLGSQKELLNMAGQQLMAAQGNYHRTLAMIGKELGIAEGDLVKWKISEDGQSLELDPSAKTPAPTPAIPGRKAGKAKDGKA